MARPLMWPFGVVVDKVGIKVGLHLLDGLVPLLAALDPEVLVEQGLRPPLRGDAGARRSRWIAAG